MTETAENIDIAEARKFLRRLKGKRCWSIKSGGSAGASLVLSIGKRVRRAQPLKNPTLSKDEREYEGEFNVLVMCGWRLHAGGKVVAGDSTPQDLRAKLLRDLQGKLVDHCNLYQATGDLKLHFQHGTILEVVADYSPLEPDLDNWQIEHGNECLSHAMTGELQIT
jgi:hypothetical protein